MNSTGKSVEGVPERDGRGELRAEGLPKAAFPGGRPSGSAMTTRGRGKVGQGFDPDAKRGKVEIVCEMWGGGRSLQEAWPIPWSFFS